MGVAAAAAGFNLSLMPLPAVLVNVRFPMINIETLRDRVRARGLQSGVRWRHHSSEEEEEELRIRRSLWIRSAGLSDSGGPRGGCTSATN